MGAGTRDADMAATATLVATPKASRTTPEAFAAALGQGLADQHAVLPLRPESLRRLDRVDAIVIDPACCAPMTCAWRASAVAAQTSCPQRGIGRNSF